MLMYSPTSFVNFVLCATVKKMKKKNDGKREVNQMVRLSSEAKCQTSPSQLICYMKAIRQPLNSCSVKLHDTLFFTVHSICSALTVLSSGTNPAVPDIIFLNYL